MHYLLISAHNVLTNILNIIIIVPMMTTDVSLGPDHPHALGCHHDSSDECPTHDQADAFEDHPPEEVLGALVAEDKVEQLL